MDVSFINNEKVFNLKHKTFYCSHPNIEIDMDLCSIKCLKCGSNIDPFSFIVGLSITENSYENRINNLKNEIKKLEKTKRELINL